MRDSSRDGALRMWFERRLSPAMRKPGSGSRYSMGDVGAVGHRTLPKRLLPRFYRFFGLLVRVPLGWGGEEGNCNLGREGGDLGMTENKQAQIVVLGAGFGGLEFCKASIRRTRKSRWWTARTIICFNRCFTRWRRRGCPRRTSRSRSARFSRTSRTSRCCWTTWWISSWRRRRWCWGGRRWITITWCSRWAAARVISGIRNGSSSRRG